MPNLDDFLNKVKKKGFQRTVEERPFYDKPMKAEKVAAEKTKSSSANTQSSGDIEKPVLEKQKSSKAIEKIVEAKAEPIISKAKILPRQSDIELAHRLASAEPLPTQSLGKISKMPRPTERSLPRHDAYSSKNEFVSLRTWQYDLLKFFLQTKSDREEVKATYPELAIRFGRDGSNIRKHLKKMIKTGLLHKVASGWIDDQQASVYRLNVIQMNEIVVQHELRRMPRQNEIDLPRHDGRSSSNNYLNSTTTEELPRHFADRVDISMIDLSAVQGVDRQKLKKYISKYSTLESLQDFVDRVACAINGQIGTKNEVKFPGAFMDSCFDRGVDVPATYRSRRALIEEEHLKREQAELDHLKKIQEERKKIEGEKLKLKFEDWLRQAGAVRIAEFEAERSRMFPKNSEFDVPAKVRMNQLRQIQADTFILENGLAMTFRESLVS